MSPGWNLARVRPIASPFAFDEGGVRRNSRLTGVISILCPFETMKTTIWFLMCSFALSSSALAAAREGEWKKVEEAIQKGLPKTAIEALDPIIQGAVKDKAYGEAAKAIARKIVLEGTIQGNKPEEKITRLEAEIAKAPPQLAPLLNTILANWYWHYFQNNRWRFMRRTATAQAPGSDFTT